MSETTYNIQNIPMAELFHDVEFNCRGQIRPTDVYALSQDIGKNGLAMPIIVQPIPANHIQAGKYKFRIVAGHRRHKAIELLKWETIPAIVRTDLSQQQAMILNLSENLQRSQLNILEEALSVSKLIPPLSEEDVASQLGQSRGWVMVRKRLLALPPPMQEAAVAKKITQADISDLYTFRNDVPAMEALYNKILDAKLTGKAVQKGVPISKSEQMKKSLKRKRTPADIYSMIELIGGTIGMCLTTRALGWTAGTVSDADFYADLKQAAESLGKSFEIPGYLNE